MKNRIAFLLVVSIVLVMSLSACGVVKDITAVNDLGKGFMTALRKGDASGSWNMLTDDIHNEVGDLTAWQAFIEPRNFSEWSFSNTEVNNDQAQMEGEATLGEYVYFVNLWFSKINDSWLISSINIEYKE